MDNSGDWSTKASEPGAGGSDVQKNQQNQNEGPHEPAILLPPVILGLIGFMLAVHLARTLALNEQGNFELELWLAFIPYRILAGQGSPDLWIPLVWTPFTHAFLHAGWEHLGFNSVWLAVFGTPMAQRYGGRKTVVLFLVSAATGAAVFAATVLPSNQWLIGASGGVAGLTGAVCRFMFQPIVVADDPKTGERVVLGRRLATYGELLHSRRAGPFIAVWLILNAAVPFLPVLIGQSVGIAWQAHLGGFIAGLALVPLLEHRARS